MATGLPQGTSKDKKLATETMAVKKRWSHLSQRGGKAGDCPVLQAWREGADLGCGEKQGSASRESCSAVCPGHLRQVHPLLAFSL